MFRSQLPMSVLLATAMCSIATVRAQDAAPAAPAKAPPIVDRDVPPTTPAMPAPPLAPTKPPEFPRNFATAFTFEPTARLSNAQPQLLLLTEMSPQAMTDWSEDLRVMGRLVNYTITRVSDGEGRRAMGIRIRALETSPATYIEGFGVVLMADTTIPLAAGAKPTTEETDAAPADAWESARRELHDNTSPTDALATSRAISELFLQLAKKQGELRIAKATGNASATNQADLERQMADLNREVAEIQQRVNNSTLPVLPRTMAFDAAKRDALITALTETLCQATHFRHLRSEEGVLLTVSGTDDAGKPMRLNLRVLKTDLDQFGDNEATKDELVRHITHLVY